MNVSYNLCLLTIYQSKPVKKVFLLSTKYKFTTIDESKKKLLEIISFYQTKFSVNITN